MASVSTIGDRRAIIFDKALELRDVDTTALSATTSTTGLEVNLTKLHSFEVVLTAKAHTGYSAGTAEWAVAVEISDTLGSGYVAVESLTLTGVATQLQVPLSGQYCQQKKAGAKYIRLTVTKTGSPGAVQVGAFINAACC